MPSSKAQQKATEKWKDAHYDLIRVNVPKGEKADIQQHAVARDGSLNKFVYRAIKETMARDSKTPED